MARIDAEPWFATEKNEPPEMLPVLVWFPQSESFAVAMFRKSVVFGWEWCIGDRRLDWKAGTLWQRIVRPQIGLNVV